MRLVKTLTAALLLSPGMVSAEPVAPGDVVFDEYGAVAESLTGVPGDPANGYTLLNKGKGNCVACHEAEAMSGYAFLGQIGPALDGVADRWSEAELRGIVADAKHTFEGSMMPSFYKDSGYIRPGDGFTGKAATEPLTPLLDAQGVEDVVAFLLTLKE